MLFKHVLLIIYGLLREYLEEAPPKEQDLHLRVR